MKVAYLSALGAGFISFFSPCILPLIPVYLLYLFSLRGNRAKNVLFFVLGFSLVFISLGIFSSLLGMSFGQYKPYLVKISSVLIILMGLVMLDLGPAFLKGILIPIGGNQIDKGPFLLGVILSISWTPCTGPVLASILLLASTTKTIIQAILLLILYSMGMAVPFIISAIFIDRIKGIFKYLSKYSKYIEWLAGIAMIAIGLLLFFDKIL